MSEATPTADSHTDLVPDEWPAARSDAPSRVLTIQGSLALPAMVLLWFFPERVGASLAGAGWRVAFAAHVLGITLGSGLIVWAEVLPWTNPVGMAPISYGPTFLSFEVVYPAPKMAFVEYLTAPFAALAISAHASSTLGFTYIRIALLILGVELGTVLLAVVLMPFAAAGEPASRLFGRCLRLAWWSTTILIPFGIGFLFDPLIRRRFELPNEWHYVDFAAQSCFAVWWLFVLLRSGYRYAGPAGGPAWEPRTPRCEGCGYILIQMSATTNCPECGKPVCESLADRRRAPAFVRADTLGNKIRMFWATHREVTTSETFFDRLAVHRDQAADRMFFLVICGINAVVMSLGVIGIGSIAGGGSFSGHLLADALVVASISMVGQVVLAGLVASAAAALGRRTVQSSAIATFYGFTGFLPLACGCLVFVLTLALVVALSRFATTLISVVLTSILAASMLAGTIWLVLAGGRCIGRAFPRTRNASA